MADLFYGSPRPIDNNKMAEIHDFYNNRDQIISLCRTVSNSLTFEGGIVLNWGSGSRLPRDSDGNAEGQLINLLMTALDWKRMFGFVPVKKYRDPETGVARGVIPQFGTGTFVQRMDRLTLSSYVEFIPRHLNASTSYMGMPYPDFVKSSTGSALNSMTRKGGAKERALAKAASKRYNLAMGVKEEDDDDDSSDQDNDNVTHNEDDGDDEEYRVFIWPGHEPDFHTESSIKSDMYTLLQGFNVYQEFKNNALNADYNSSNPTVFTQSRMDPGKYGAANLTEADLFDDYDREEMTGEERHQARREYLRTMRSREVQGQLMSQDSVRRETKRKMYDERTGRFVDQQRRRVWENNIYPIEYGSQLAPQPSLPHSRPDVLQWKADYEQQACLTMGVPHQYIAGLRGARIKGETEQEFHLLRLSVEQNRKDCKDFIEFLWNFVFLENDNETLVKSLWILDSTKKKLEEEAKQYPDREDIVARKKQLGYYKRRVKSLAKGNRIELQFRKSPFAGILRLQDILTAAAVPGVMTELERTNLIRGKLDLPAATSIATDGIAPRQEKVKRAKTSHTSSPSSSSSKESSAPSAAPSEE